MIYVLHGEDEFTRSVKLAQWKAKLGDPTIAGLNTTVLDGQKVRLTDLMQACDAVPFMGRRRLVIVEDYWSRFEPPRERGPKGERPQPAAADMTFLKGLSDYLPRLPETTRLIFVETRALDRANPAFHILPADEKRVYIKEFHPPSERSLPRWIERHMKAKGGTITPRAAQELTRFIGTDLRQLDQELEKLLAYANFERSVTIHDVHNLVSAKQLSDIFDLVDAIGMRQSRAAMRYLHELLEAGAPPMYVLSMIQRQFRILLQVKELSAEGARVAEMQEALGIRYAFIIEKAVKQGANFSMERLESIYVELAEVEQNIKTGQIGDLLALDLFVAEVCA